MKNSQENQKSLKSIQKQLEAYQREDVQQALVEAEEESDDAAKRHYTDIKEKIKGLLRLIAD